MPRRRIPIVLFPADSTAAGRGQRHRRATPTSSRTTRPGEAIAERRAMALELRKAGGSYREIARQLAVDVHTAHADVQAELAALRETTVGRAEELRDLELQRFDEMTAGLWPQIRKGQPASRDSGGSRL